MRRRLLAVVALVVGAASLALAVAVVVSEFPRGLVVVACMLVAGTVAWYAVLRRGAVRTAGLIVAGLALAGAVVVLLTGRPLLDLLVVVGVLVALGAACATLVVEVDLPDAQPAAAPRAGLQPALGRRQGGAVRAGGRGARARHRADRVRPPVGPRRARAQGGRRRRRRAGHGRRRRLAGLVAAIAAELDLPYSCIPAGTRNHFALDLGVDRDDVVGALDAFVDGGERRVDLAEVNGRVFVNNVSLGLYAEAVQHEGYRDAKLRTILDTVPDVLGPGGGDLDLRWHGPGGHEHRSGAAILVSNNRYRLGRAVGSGHGLGSTTACSGSPSSADPPAAAPGAAGPALWREWSAPSFEVDAERAVPAGIDGEALVLEAPLRFQIRPGVLRVRIARAHPGASPSANAPEGRGTPSASSCDLALGREHEPQPQRSTVWI